MNTKKKLLTCLILSLLMVFSFAAMSSAAVPPYSSSALLGDVSDFWGHTYHVTLLYTPSSPGPSTDYEYKVTLGSYSKIIQGSSQFNAFFPVLLDAQQKYAFNKTASKAAANQAYTYITGLAPAKDSDATLSNLYVNRNTVSGFSPTTYTYNVTLPARTTTIPRVTATVNDIGKANAVITQAASVNGSAKVVVTAEDNTTSLTYTINFTVKVPVTTITVSGTGGQSTVKKNNTLQMTANVLPANAANKNVTWSVSNGSGKAKINSSGLLTGTKAGTVTVKATAKDGSNVSGRTIITIINS